MGVLPALSRSASTRIRQDVQTFEDMKMQFERPDTNGLLEDTSVEHGKGQTCREIGAIFR